MNTAMLVNKTLETLPMCISGISYSVPFNGRSASKIRYLLTNASVTS